MTKRKNKKLNKKDILERCLNYGVLIIKIADQLPKNPAGYKIAGQLVDAGTSVGANMEEAQESVSRNDFIYKVNISLKECRESIFWLKIISKSKLLKDKIVGPGIEEGKEIKSILATIIWKTKKGS